MKKLFTIFLILTLSFSTSFGQDAQQRTLLDSAKSLYDHSKYQKSAAIYQTFVDSGLVSSTLYYNLGNCKFKLGDKAFTVLYYERALKVSPGNEDVIHNLSVINGTLIDKFEKLPSFSVRPLFTTINAVISYNVLGGLSVLSLLIAALVFYKMKQKGNKFSFSNSWVILVIALFLYLWGAVQKSQLLTATAAVVSVNGLEVHSEPNNSSTLLFELNEGTKVELSESAGEWYSVKTQDGNQGWAQKKLLLEI